MATSLTTPQHPTRIALRAWGLFSGLMLMMLSNGLLVTVVGLRAELEGFATGTTGLVMAAYYIGFLIGARVAPQFVATVGHIRVFAALASLASVSALVHVIDVNPTTWAAMRLITGFAYAGLYITAESWLNDSVTNRNRGLLLSIYMVIVMGGVAAGQALLAIADPRGVTLFVLASVLVSVAVVPVTLSVGPAPEFRSPRRLGIREIWHAAPLGVVTGAGVGMANGAMWGLGAVYAARAGMSQSRIALFLAATVVGSIITQIPIGMLSDRIRRRWAILTITTAATGAAVWAGNVDPNGPIMIAAVLAFGGLTFPLYSLGLSHINDHVPAGAAVAVSSLYVLVNGLGAVVGPLAAAYALDRAGTRGFFGVIAIFHAAIGVFALVRISLRKGLPVERQRRFTLVPARAGSVVIQMARRWQPTRTPSDRERPPES